MDDMIQPIADEMRGDTAQTTDTQTARQQPTENGYTKVEMPLDIVMSLLRPDELEKLQRYIASYLGQHWQPRSIILAKRK